LSEYELRTIVLQQWGLIVSVVLAIGTLALAAVALWGERLRQWWNRPRLRLSLGDPNLTHLTPSKRKGWYYQLHIENDRIPSPAENVEVRLTHVYLKGPDDSWQEHHFSGPVQVMWREPEARTRTIGPDAYATFAYLLEDEVAAHLQLYWRPNNLEEAAKILPNRTMKLRFKVVSNTAQSNELAIEIAWDGTWVEGRSEMPRHMVVKESAS
jgi:hypothetical protein